MDYKHKSESKSSIVCFDLQIRWLNKQELDSSSLVDSIVLNKTLSLFIYF